MTDFVACTHCGLPVPSSRIVSGSEEQFCCIGCETVYKMLNQCDLQDYYELAQSTREEPDPRSDKLRAYSEFDDPTFKELYTKKLDSGYRQVEFYLEGVHCATCVWLLEKLPSMLEGIYESRVNFRRSMVSLVWEPEKNSLSNIAQFIDRLGYPPHPYRDLHHEDIQKKEDRSFLIRIGVAGACAGNAMLIAFALYSGVFSSMSDEFRRFFYWASFLVTLPAVFWSGSIFFRGAFAALRSKTLHMDLPIAIGIGAGFIWGTFNTFRGAGEVYFDSVTALIFLLLVGRWIQRRQQRIATQATDLLYSLSPFTAHRVEGDEVIDVPVEALKTGDLVEVRAGENIPVDGLIQEGNSDLDVSFLTGESLPMSVSKDMNVHAGALNLSARLRIVVQKTGNETRLGQLLQTVEDASQRRSPTVQMVDRLAGIFVAVVLTLAFATFFFWVHQGVHQAVEHFVALLIVSCPCALGLATPLALSASLGRAAREGILIKGGDVLEAMAKPGRLWLDKTGTLTEGKQSLVKWYGDDSVKALVYAVESQSSHPIAKAFTQAFEDEPKVEGWDEVQVRQHIASGITGEANGQILYVGSPAFLRDEFDGLSDEIEEKVSEFSNEGLTPVVIALDSEVVAVAGLGDPIRDDALSTLNKLRKEGWEIGILSGDHSKVVEAVARQLDLPLEDCHGELSPEDKLAFIEKEKEKTTVMVGDGINDAAALSAADVGVAVHGGAEASLTIADIFLSNPGLGALYQLFLGASRTQKVIKRSLRFSLFYNTIGASLAMAGIVTPLWAAILMPISSLTVITSSYRSKTFNAKD